jgi:hypothetical protein
MIFEEENGNSRKNTGPKGEKYEKNPQKELKAMPC